MPPITQTAFMQISRSINSVGDSFFKRTYLYKKQRQAYTPAVVLFRRRLLLGAGAETVFGVLTASEHYSV